MLFNLQTMKSILIFKKCFLIVNFELLLFPICFLIILNKYFLIYELVVISECFEQIL